MRTESELPGPEGTRFSVVRHVEETGSTNADLLAEATALAADGGPLPSSVLVADLQLAGRGRQRRQWHGERANTLMVSVLTWPHPAWAPLTPLVAGLAVVEGIDAVVGTTGAVSWPSSDSSPVALKWPNDVLVPGHDDRKLAGILVEATTTRLGLAAVVGVGLNLRWDRPPPPEVAERAVTLEEVVGRSIDRWELVRALLTALDRRLQALETEGQAQRAAIDALLGDYRQRCATIGREVRFETSTGVVQGPAIAVDDSGALVVDSPAGPVALTAGDAHHV